MGQLTAQGIKKIGDGRHSDGEGLFFFVRGNSRSWVYRFQLNKRRRDMYLGKYPAMSLAEARLERSAAHALKERDIDPIVARKEPVGDTLRDWLGRWLRANRHDLASPKNWLSPLRTHVLPKLGKTDIKQITSKEIVAVIHPTWRTKTSAAQKALDRLGIVMRYADAELNDVDISTTRRADQPRVTEPHGEEYSVHALAGGSSLLRHPDGDARRLDPAAPDPDGIPLGANPLCAAGAI